MELLDKYFGSVSNLRKIKTKTNGQVNSRINLNETHNYTINNQNWIYQQVCELDIIFNFEKAYFILDELLIGGEIQETSKKNVLKAIAAQDVLQEVSTPEDNYEL